MQIQREYTEGYGVAWFHQVGMITPLIVRIQKEDVTVTDQGRAEVRIGLYAADSVGMDLDAFFRPHSHALSPHWFATQEEAVEYVQRMVMQL